MMKKNEREFIHKSLDGELNKDETRILRRRLQDDPEVRRTYEELKAIEESSRQVVRPIEVPPDFTEKVIGKIRDTQCRRRPE